MGYDCETGFQQWSTCHSSNFTHLQAYGLERFRQTAMTANQRVVCALGEWHSMLPPPAPIAVVQRCAASRSTAVQPQPSSQDTATKF